MEYILEIDSLRKEYDDFILKDISFRLPYGFIMGLVGPNGAGKTTIIKLIMNLLRKQDGSIRVFGKDHIEHEIAVKARIGFVYDNPNFYEHLNLKQMKNVIAPFYPTWDDSLFRKYAQDFELPLTKKIKELSRGMKMKYALLIALSHHADFIVMDEPTSGLDPVFRREFLEILQEFMQDEKKSILFSTHITTDLERVADYITFVHGGELVFSGSKDDILENYGILKGGNELLTPEVQKDFLGCRESEFGFEALTAGIKEARKKYREDMVAEKASLEDIMFFLAKGGAKNGGGHV